MKQEVPFSDVMLDTIERLKGKGILLVAGDLPNPMTIGWGTLGSIWNKQIFTVMVRPVRYTFGLMEEQSDFSVCILPEKYNKDLDLCGTQSSRDIDKFFACNFHAERCQRVDSFFIAESLYHFECRIIHKHYLNPETLDPAINKRFYPKLDYHMVYYGEILGIYR